MIEAVGEQFWPRYFSQLRDRLLPGGLAGIQAITIQDKLFQTYRREVDFIQRYVFPGGMLPSPQILKSLGEKFGVPVIRERIFGQDYAKTLAIWRNNFRAAWPNLMPSGFDDRFRRLWEYYLAYCEAGFLSGNIDVRQVVFAKTEIAGSQTAVRCKSGFHFGLIATLGSLPDLATDWQDFRQMKINNDVIEAIGNTPLIKLKRASEETGCTILGKAEFMNPGQSVKDRAGKWMILEAEKRGDLKPGGLVVESTAGNTGIGLAVVASARGYRTLIVIPETQSQEKKDMLRLCGAELVEVPALPFSNPNNYQHVGKRLADQLAQDRAQRRAVRRPVEQSRQRQGALRIDRTGDLAADRRQDRRLHLLGRHRRHAGRHQPLPEGKEQGHRHRLRRSAWLCDV